MFGMTLEFKILIGGEWAWFLQQATGDFELTDIVQAGSANQFPTMIDTPAKADRKCPGEESDPLAVLHRRAVIEEQAPVESVFVTDGVLVQRVPAFQRRKDLRIR